MRKLSSLAFVITTAAILSACSTPVKVSEPAPVVERPADKAEHEHRADAETTAAARNAETATTTTVVATVVNIIAATEIIVTHRAIPSFPCALGSRWRTTGAT